MTDKRPTLEELRAEIDHIDTILHDLIMERTQIIDKVSQVKKRERVKIRPSREAEMLYRLSSRHQGKFPKQVLFRIWREIISGTLTLEGPFCVAIQTPHENTGYVDLARDHYGSYSEISCHESAVDVMSAIASDQAAVGILPFPVQDSRDDWWHSLSQFDQDEDSIRIVARLPFFGRSSALGANLDALVISYAAPVETERDISLFSFTTDHEASREDFINAFKRNDLDVRSITASPRINNEACKALIEIEGFHDGVGLDLPEDISDMKWLGSYSEPIGDAELSSNGGPLS